jgi:hypothetical protein
MVKRSRLPKGAIYSAEHRLEAMPMMFYASWYKTDVAPKLTREQKEKLLKKISDISLEKPISDVGLEFDKKEFPELAPYAHTEKISGLQLYAVMTELFAELHPEMSKKIGKPYAELPF